MKNKGIFYNLSTCCERNVDDLVYDDILESLLGISFFLLITDHLSAGPGRAIGRVCVCVCVSVCLYVRTMTFEQNNLWCRYRHARSLWPYLGQGHERSKFTVTGWKMFVFSATDAIGWSKRWSEFGKWVTTQCGKMQALMTLCGLAELHVCAVPSATA